MKKFHSIFTLLLLTVAFVLPACGDDDDEPGKGGDVSAVVGTWRGDDYDHYYSNVTITFNENGTGTATIEHYGAYITVRRAQFTYKVKGSTVTTNGTLASANSDGETDTQDFNNKYEVSGDRLIVKSGNSWYMGVVSSYKR